MGRHNWDPENLPSPTPACNGDAHLNDEARHISPENVGSIDHTTCQARNHWSRLKETEADWSRLKHDQSAALALHPNNKSGEAFSDLSVTRFLSNVPQIWMFGLWKEIQSSMTYDKHGHLCGMKLSQLSHQSAKTWWSTCRILPASGWAEGHFSRGVNDQNWEDSLASPMILPCLKSQGLPNSWTMEYCGVLQKQLVYHESKNLATTEFLNFPQKNPLQRTTRRDVKIARQCKTLVSKRPIIRFLAGHIQSRDYAHTHTQQR